MPRIRGDPTRRGRPPQYDGAATTSSRQHVDGEMVIPGRKVLLQPSQVPEDNRQPSPIKLITAKPFLSKGGGSF